MTLEQLKTLIEDMKSKYPQNLEGLEPALTDDIVQIVMKHREDLAEEIKGLVSKDNDYQKNSGIYEAHDLVIGVLLKD